jgi:hypothetical protein
LHEVALVVDHSRREAAGEEMPEAAMSFVERLRVAAVQTLEPPRELRLRRVQDDVVVRRHQAESVHRPPEPLRARAKEREEVPAVGVVDEDVAPSDAARHHVEVAVGKARAENAGHTPMKPPETAMHPSCGQTGTNSAHPAASRRAASRV